MDEQASRLGSGGERQQAIEPPGSPEAVAAAGLIGCSDSFLRLVRKLPRLACSNATVLISGETGTGKELIANAIHAMSPRAPAPFIPVNCGALPEELVENELFGHARGAYTGAAGSGKGLLAEAEGGTLFLDELNSLSLSAQSKLLRFLQNREYRMLGSTKLLRADVRILAATNVDLRTLVGLGSFRSDLYHRLHVLSVEVPPLRARQEDIPLLASHFASTFGQAYGKGRVYFSPDAMDRLLRQEWPGNVRELQSVVERAVLLSTESELGVEDLELQDEEARPGGVTKALAAGTSAASGAEGTEFDCEPFRTAKDRAVRQFERMYLIQVMTAANGNVSRASRLAGMQRRDLQRLLRKHDVRGPTRPAWHED